MDLEEEVSGSCCNLLKATHFLISSTTSMPSSSTSVNIAILQIKFIITNKFNGDVHQSIALTGGKKYRPG